MAHETDPGFWQSVGLAIGGVISGVAVACKLKRGKPRPTTHDGGESTRSDIQALKDQVRDMKSEIAHLKENATKDAEALQRMDAKHNEIIVEIFKKLETIGLNVNTMQTEIRLVINRGMQ